MIHLNFCFFFFSSRRRHTRYWRDWSSDVCSSDLKEQYQPASNSGGFGRNPQTTFDDIRNSTFSESRSSFDSQSLHNNSPDKRLTNSHGYGGTTGPVIPAVRVNGYFSNRNSDTIHANPVDTNILPSGYTSGRHASSEFTVSSTAVSEKQVHERTRTSSSGRQVSDQGYPFEDLAIAEGIIPHDPSHFSQQDRYDQQSASRDQSPLSPRETNQMDAPRFGRWGQRRQRFPVDKTM